jgi:hypothetical protein
VYREYLVEGISTYTDHGGAKFFRNVGSYKSHGVTSQKTKFLIVTAVKTSELTDEVFVSTLCNTSDSNVLVFLMKGILVYVISGFVQNV